MILFAALQESIRALRGKHDAINSGVAGAVAGAIIAGHYQGPQYRLLAATLWGPICLASHLVNKVAQPRPLIEDWLINEGLLDPVVRERRTNPVLDKEEAMPIETLIDMATRIRDQELQSLFDASKTNASETSKSKSGPSKKQVAAVKTVVEEKGESSDYLYETWLVEAKKSGIAISLDDDATEDEVDAAAKRVLCRSWVDWARGRPKLKE